MGAVGSGEEEKVRNMAGLMGAARSELVTEAAAAAVEELVEVTVEEATRAVVREGAVAGRGARR